MSLLYKIFFTIFICLILFFSLFINQIVNNEGKRQLDSLLLKIENNKHFYTPILSQLLYTFDEKTLEIYLSSIYLHKEVVNIDFIDFTSTINFKYGSDINEKEELIKSEIFLKKDDIKLGKLDIYYSQKQIKKNINDHKKNLLQISIFFLILTFIIIFYFIKKITSSIDNLAKKATLIADGNLSVSTNIKSSDEIGLLANKIEIMKNALLNRIRIIEEQRKEILISNNKLKKTGIHYKQIFQNAEVSILNGNFSLVYKELENLRKKGIKDLKQYIKENENFLIEIIKKIKITDLNNAALKLFEADNKSEFINQTSQTFTKDRLDFIKKELLAIWNKEEIIREEVKFTSLKGRKIRAIVSANFPKDKNLFKNVPIIILDITEKYEKEKLFYRQSKMAAMGEMLENIAHQWRQPLSAISTAATGSQIKKEVDVLTDEEFIIAMDTINDSAQYLSQTIDDFRNFFNPNIQNIMEFEISDTIKKTLNLISSKFISKDIKIIEQIENQKISSLENELIQVLINILNNARDALNIKQNQKKLIFIKTYKKDNLLCIEVLDNAGGINQDIINRIFEPYFTTKYKSKGTGIGLYMSLEIIEKHLKGDIQVVNENYEYENISYRGAKFTITLKLDLLKE